VGTEIQQNRYDQLMRRVGGLIGPGAKVAEVLAELFPVIDVERVPGELLILSGTRICIGGGQFSSAVGQSPKVQLFNPVDSGNLITVTRLVVSVSADATIRFGPVIVALTTGIGTETFRDMRLSLTQRPIGEIRQDTDVSLADGTGQVRVQASDPYTMQDENGIVVLPPGTGFEIGATTTNSTIAHAWNWRERVAEQSELNL